MSLVKSKYSSDDVIILLQDLEGKVEILDTAEREKRIQSEVHYSEMLPLEYKPTEDYMRIYDKSLGWLSYTTAIAVKLLAEKLFTKHGDGIVLVSLARAGTPIGILLKRYLKYKYSVNAPHYSISIIRGKGIDIAAMKYIYHKHGAKHIQFIDGWIGKGTINNVLKEAVEDFKNRMRSESDTGDINELSSALGVLSDPANITELCGTHQDFLIPSACLNATVSGLVSRTVKLPSMTDEEYHGAVYYEEYESLDKSLEFIDKVSQHFKDIVLKDLTGFFNEPSVDELSKGIDDINYVADKYGIEDINFIKPGIGETTRVLLRRVPYIVLVKEGSENSEYIRHIYRLAEEKGIKVEVASLKAYSVIGVIKRVET